jgi:hypothetical protein
MLRMVPLPASGEDGNGGIERTYPPPIPRPYPSPRPGRTGRAHGQCSCGDGDEVRAGPGSRGLLDRSGAMRKHPHHPPARGRTAKPDKGCLPSLLIRRASRSVSGRLTLAKPAPNRHPGQPGRSAPPPQPSGSEPVRRRSRASHQSSPERSERGGGLAERGRRGRRGAFRIELIARRSIVQRPRYPTTMLRMVPLPASGEDGEEKTQRGHGRFRPCPRTVFGR